MSLSTFWIDKNMEQKKTIRISVRNLVEFILREGDIDNRIAGTTEKDAMQLGSKIHRKIQRQMGSFYRAEVPLKIQIPSARPSNCKTNFSYGICIFNGTSAR